MNNSLREIGTAIVFQDKKIIECLSLGVLAPEQMMRIYESMGEAAKLDFVAACINRICLQESMLRSVRGGTNANV